MDPKIKKEIAIEVIDQLFIVYVVTTSVYTCFIYGEKEYSNHHNNYVEKIREVTNKALFGLFTGPFIVPLNVMKIILD